MPCFFWSSSPAHSFFIIYKNAFGMSEWEDATVGAEERWGVVIAIDPFLYESRHSLPHGKGSFLEGGNGFFFSYFSLRWAECKLHPDRPLHSQDQSWLPLASHNSLPFSSPVRSWEIFPSCLCTKGHIREGACLHVSMLSFFIQSLILSVSLLMWIEGTLQLQQCILNFNLAAVCFGRLNSTLQK